MRCFFQGCSWKAQYYCKCTETGTYTCSAHWEAHTRQQGNTHVCQRVYDNQFQETKIRIIYFLNKEKSDMDKLRVDILRQHWANAAKTEKNLERCLNEVEFKLGYIKNAINSILNAKEINSSETNPFLAALTLKPEEGVDACRQLLGNTQLSLDDIYKYDERYEGIVKKMIESELKRFEKKCLQLAEEKIKQIDQKLFGDVLETFNRQIMGLNDYCKALEEKIAIHEKSIIYTSKCISDLKNYEYMMQDIIKRSDDALDKFEHFQSARFKNKIKEEIMEVIKTERTLKFMESIHCINANCESQKLGAYYFHVKQLGNLIQRTNEKIFWSCSLHASGRDGRFEQHDLNVSQFSDL